MARGIKPRDYGIDCADALLTRAAQAKWYKPSSQVPWTDISKFYSISACAKITDMTLVTSQNVSVVSLADGLSIVRQVISDDRINSICAQALGLSADVGSTLDSSIDVKPPPLSDAEVCDLLDDLFGDESPPPNIDAPTSTPEVIVVEPVDMPDVVSVIAPVITSVIAPVVTLDIEPVVAPNVAPVVAPDVKLDIAPSIVPSTLPVIELGDTPSTILDTKVTLHTFAVVGSNTLVPELYRWQVDAIDCLSESLGSDLARDAPVVARIACGAGKSRVLIELLNRDPKLIPCAVFVPSIALLEQFRDEVTRWAPQFTVKLNGGGFSSSGSAICNITVSTYHSAMALEGMSYNFIVVDEAHHVFNEFAIEYTNAEEIEFDTAVADDHDETKFAAADESEFATAAAADDKFEFASDDDSDVTDDDVVATHPSSKPKRIYANAIRALCESCSCRSLLVSATLPSDDSYAYTYDIGDAVNDNTVVDYHIVIPVFNGVGCRRAGLRTLLKVHPEWTRVLAYCNTVAAAAAFAAECSLDGIAAATFSGSTPLAERNRIIDELRVGNIRVIATVNTLGEGVNIQEADTCLFVEPRNSSINVTQCVGRVLRICPTTGKQIATIILPAADEERELVRFMGLMICADARLAKQRWRSGGRTSVIVVSELTSTTTEEDEHDAEIEATLVFDRLGMVLAGSSDERWQRNADLVREYVVEFGHLPPQGKGGVYRDVNLGSWISNQRQAKKGNKGSIKITPDRERVLESIPGWWWEQDIDAVWQQNADLLRMYVAEFGHIPPASSKGGVYCDVNLGTWIGSQRKAKKGKGTCKLTPDREYELEAIPGWFWDIDAAWQQNADLVREYVAEFGRLPPQGKGGIYRDVNLGSWTNHQRQAKKGNKGVGKLTPDRERALESIPGWYWEQDVDAAWQQTADLLREYVAEFGRLPPQTKGGIYRDVNLGNWIGNQRSAKKGTKNNYKMTPDRERELESIPGWFWEQDIDAAWQQTADLLCEYVAEFGRLPPQTKGGIYRDVNLGTWISGQRKAKKGKANGCKMTPGRERELESIPGWFWELDVDAAWQQNADLLREYVAEFGRLPPHGKCGIYRDVNLGQWISNQRSAKKGKANGCKMTPDRERELESIPGWLWNPDDDIWQQNADLLREYVAEYGRLPPKSKGGIYRDVNLGTWIGNQRSAKKGTKGGSRMTPDRERELEAIPGWRW